MDRPNLPNMSSKTPEWEALEKACEDYLSEVEGERDVALLLDQAVRIAQEALMLVYGPSVKEWILEKFNGMATDDSSL